MSSVADRSDRGLSEFHPVRVRKAPEEVVAVLIDALRAGLYAPGDLLPRERDLAERLAVSRLVVREAIEMLRAEGIVSTRRGRSGGTVVDSFDNLTRLQASLHTETRASIRAVLEYRRPLELTAGLLAARRASDDDLAAMWSLVDDLEATVGGSHAEMLHTDVRFHVQVAELSGNALLRRSLSSTLAELILVREHFPIGHVDMAQAVENQRVLLRAISGRDEAVIVDAVEDHLGALEDILLGVRLEFGCLPNP